MSMQVIEKRVWCFTVSPGPLSILEEDDELDGDFEEDEKADPEDVLGPDDEDDEEDFEYLNSASNDEGDEDFEVRLVVDFHSTIDRVLEMFNASRAVLGVGPNDTVTGLIAESTAVQLHASLTH